MRQVRSRKLPAQRVPASSADRSSPPIPARMDGAGRARRCGCPGVSGAYKLGTKMVLKGGYGLYYDTLNAGRLQPQPDRLRRHDDEHDRARTSGGRGSSAIRRTGSRRSRSVSGACGRQPLRHTVGDVARSRHAARPGLHLQEPEPRARTRRSGGGSACSGSLLATWRWTSRTTAGTRTAWRSISRRAIVPEQYWQLQERARQHPADLPADQRDEPISHHQFRVAAGHQPHALSAHGGQCVLHVRDDSAAEPAPRLPADDSADLWRFATGEDQGPTSSKSR